MSAPWLIWSHEHQAFWKPHECGYTKFIEAAGRYSRERAETICRNAGLMPHQYDVGNLPNEICFPAPEAVIGMEETEACKIAHQRVGLAIGEAGRNAILSNAYAKAIYDCSVKVVAQMLTRGVADPVCDKCDGRGIYIGKDVATGQEVEIACLYCDETGKAMP